MKGIPRFAQGANTTVPFRPPVSSDCPAFLVDLGDCTFAVQEFSTTVPLVPLLWFPFVPGPGEIYLLWGGELHCHSHPMGNCISPLGNCISPCVLCSFTMRFAYFAHWGNVFWIQEFKNITMPSTGIPPFPHPPLVRGVWGGKGCIKTSMQAPTAHCDPPGHRQRHYIPARRRQDQGPPEAPPEKVPREAPAEHAKPRHPQKGMTLQMLVAGK